MRIEQIDAYVVKLPRLNIAENIPDYVRPRKSLSYDTTPPIDDMAAARYAEALFVKITADNGLVGWGEGQSLLVPEATKAVVDRLFAPILIGENPLAREKLYDMTYGTMRGRGYRSGYLAAALAGINNALWDLSGKALDVPCYVLLGGPYRDKVRIYNNIQGPTPEVGVEQALKAVEMGYDAVKYHLIRPLKTAVAVVEATREAVGPDVDILVDLTWHYDVPGAIALGKELEKFDVFWLESPVPSEDLRRHCRSTRATSHYPSASARNITTPINSALFWKHMPPTFSCPTSREQASRAASASPTSPKPSTSHSPLQLAQATSFLPLRNFSYRQAFSTLSSWNTSTRASS